MNGETDDQMEVRGLHHRIYPYTDSLVQYATDITNDPETRPWIVRDRSTALRNERQGRGKALVRVWVPTSWEYVNDAFKEQS